MRKPKAIIMMILLLSSLSTQFIAPSTFPVEPVTPPAIAQRSPGIQYQNYLLINPNFNDADASGMPDIWNYEEWGTNPEAIDGWYTTSQYHSSPGSGALRIQYTSRTCEAGWTQPFTYTGTVPVNQANVTFWWRCSTYTSAGSLNYVEIYLEALRGSGNWIKIYGYPAYPSARFTSTTSWAQVTVDLKPYIDLYGTGTYQFEADVYLSTGSSGTPQVRVQYDDVQVWVKYTVEFPPSGQIIRINNDATYTRSRNVTLNVYAEGANQMQFSNDKTTWSPWETFALTKAWTLTANDGTKTVYYRTTNGIAPDPSPVNDTIIYDGSAPNTPTLVSPTNNTAMNNNAPQFTWNSVSDNGPSGLAKYTLQYSKDSTFATGTTTVNLTQPTTSYTPSQLADGTWYWRVRGVDAAENAGPWSPLNRFVVIDTVYPLAPALVAPSSGYATNDDTPTLTWYAAEDPSPSSSVASYTLQYSMDPLFSGATTVPGLTGLSYTTPTLANGVWYWRVRTIDRAGNQGGYSGYWSVVIDTASPGSPNLSLPLSGAQTNDNTTTLYWDAATDPSPTSGIVSYTLYYANNPSFTGATTIQGLTGTSYTTPVLANGVWYWRVRAIDRAGNQGSNSTAFNFRVDTVGPSVPNQLSPANGISTSDNTPDFRWSKATDAGSGVGSYVLELDTENLFNTSNKTDIAGLTGNWTLTTPLGDDTWYWRVRGVDQVGNNGSWSTIRSLTIDTKIPGAPTLVSPTNAFISSNSTQVFKWTLVGANSYDLHIDNNSDVNTPEFNFIGLTNDSKVVFGLGDDTWYWKVVAQRVGGSNSSTIWVVIIDGQAPTQPTLSSPSNATYTNDNTPTLAWSGADDATSGIASYTLQYANNSSFTGATTIQGLTGTSYTTPTLVDGVWYWRVRAVDRAGNQGSNSQYWNLQIDTVPPSGLSMSAASGDYSNTLTVTLNINANGATKMYLSNDNTTWNEYNYASSQAWVLTGGDGTKHVYLRCTDAAGNTASLPTTYITITLDTILPSGYSPSQPASGSSTNVNSTTFVWSAAQPGGTEIAYNLQYSKDPAFTSGVTTRTTLYGTNCTASTPLTDGTWYWHVNATDIAGNRGYYSATYSFDIDTVGPSKPALIRPSNGFGIATVSAWFNWTFVVDAAWYRIQIARNSSFTVGLIEKSDVIYNATRNPTAVEYFPARDSNATLAEGTWYWRVEAFDLTGNPSGYTSIRSLIVDVTGPGSVALVGPPTQSYFPTNPTFSWNAVPGASSYWLKCDIVSTFNSPDAKVKTDIATTSDTIPQTLYNGIWYWSVRAVDTAGNFDNETSVQIRTLRIDKVSPVAPPIGTPSSLHLTRINTTTLSWSGASDPISDGVSSGIANYTLQYANNPSFSGASIVPGLTSLSYPFPAALTDGPWYWRVLPIDKVGNVGPYSQNFSFIVDTHAPSPPSVSTLYPSNVGVGVAKVTFSWNASTDQNGIMKYVIQIDTSDSFNSNPLRVNKTVVGETYTSEIELSNGKWYWRIAAVDNAGNVGSYSEAIPFTVNVVGGLSPMMVLIAGGGSSGVLVLALLGYVLYRRAKIPFMVKKIDQSIKLISRGEVPQPVPMRTRAEIVGSIFLGKVAIIKQATEEFEKKKKERESKESSAAKGRVAGEVGKGSAVTGRSEGEQVDAIVEELQKLEVEGRGKLSESTELIRREIEELEKGIKKEKKKK